MSIPRYGNINIGRKAKKQLYYKFDNERECYTVSINPDHTPIATLFKLYFSFEGKAVGAGWFYQIGKHRIPFKPIYLAESQGEAEKKLQTMLETGELVRAIQNVSPITEPDYGEGWRGTI